MHVDPASQIPVFRQIADYLRGGIASGAYRPGEVLPSKRALAMKLGVNPLTVQHAFAVLESEGLVSSRRGVGMFVGPHARKLAREQSENVCYQQLVQVMTVGRLANLSESQLGRLIKRALVESRAQLDQAAEERS